MGLHLEGGVTRKFEVWLKHSLIFESGFSLIELFGSGLPLVRILSMWISHMWGVLGLHRFFAFAGSLP